MSVRRVVPNIASPRVDESRDFYCSLFGFDVAMDLRWIVTLVSHTNPTAQINLAGSEGGSGPQLTIEVDDVDAVHAEAVAREVEIAYPLTDEPWGVRRFFVVDPNGVVVNVMSHVA